MNVYATLDELKGPNCLNVSGAEHDAGLLRILTAASRQIEKPELAGRWFYCLEQTRYYDGPSTKLWLPDDILSVTTLKCDRDGDATYEITMTSSDYYLYPLNSYPKTLLKINVNGSYACFAPGISKGLEIAGVFGYADSATPYEVKTAINQGAGITAVATDFPVDDGSLIKIGQTIKADSEQMDVTDIAGNTIYVKRGVNGTTAATHTDDTDIYVYTYPEDITQATLILAMRAWKRKDSAFQDVVGLPETGQVVTAKGLDPDVVKLVAPYRRQEYA